MGNHLQDADGIDVTDARSEALLGFISKYTEIQGYPPSTRDMAEALGFRSVESIHRMLKELRDSGRVTWEPRKARTLRVVDQ